VAEIAWPVCQSVKLRVYNGGDDVADIFATFPGYTVRSAAGMLTGEGRRGCYRRGPEGVGWGEGFSPHNAAARAEIESKV